jgi:Putative beta barrel porin-7 (BBP7)
MTDRMLVALGTALLVAGSTWAEAPPAAPPASSPQILIPAPAAPGQGFGPSAGTESGPDGQFWVTAEYVFGWFSGDRMPPLVTTSPSGTARASAGVLGGPTTTLFGGDQVNDDFRSGGRITAGYWFTPERICGIEAGFLMMESQSSGFAAASDGSTILARPFLDVTNNQAASALVAFPGSSSGSVAARASSGSLYMANLDLTENIVDLGWFRLDSLFGYRFYRYDEGVRVRQSITNIPSAPGTVFSSQDDFSTFNEFHGGDFGLRAQFVWDDFTLGLLTKCAVGSVNRDVKIIGVQQTTAPGFDPVIREGGLLALSSNIGDHHGHDWTLLPELGVTLGWQASSNVRLTFGYSVLWFEQIARAGDQIDLNVNPSLFPSATGTATGASRPAFLLTRSDLWLQTINVGVEFTY